MNISHSSGFLLSQFESLPLLSIENLLFERRFVDKNLETLKNVISCAEKSAKIRKAEERTKTNLHFLMFLSFYQKIM